MELLEREAILAELRLRWSQASSGSGRVILLGGVAGVGKSVLLRRFAAELTPEARVLRGQCDPLATPRPLGPLFDIASGDARLERLLADSAPRDVIFRALLSSLATGSKPALLVIEDAHWADEATLDLVRYLARRVEATRSLTVISYRDDEIGPRHPLRQMFGDLATAGTIDRLSVEPLTVEGVAILATGTGIDPTHLHARTRGNPFFVTEVLAAGGSIPETVRDAVLARAARLPHDAWQTLEAAAVIGATIEPQLLVVVAKPASDALEALFTSGMVANQGKHLAFRHELARDAMLHEISPARSTTLHALVLQALAAAPIEQQNAARLAHLAEGAGDQAAVLRYARAAGQRAAALGAHREATEQFERALRFADARPPQERASLLEALAHECSLTAQVERALAAREAARDIWRELGDRRREGENRCHLALLHWADARMDEANQEAAAAVAILEALPPGRELALAYGTLARLRGTTLNDAEAIGLGERAIALAESVGANETLADALITVGVARLARGNFALGRAQLERSIALSTDAGLDELAARAYANLGFGYDEHYQFDLAAKHYTDGIRFCAERELDHFRQHMTAWLARCRLFLGNWTDASELAASVLAAHEVAPVTRFVALLVEAMVWARSGRSGAMPLLDEALALAEASGSLYRLGPVRAARAEAAWLSGDVSSAAAEARANYDLAVEHGQRWYTGELAYWRWKTEERFPLPRAIAEPFARQIANDWLAAATAWDALRCPYEAARARSESADETELRAALTVCEDLGAAPLAAFIRKRLRQIGARGIPRGPRPSTASSPAGLTARETEVLALAAAGHGNQAIAERLFLSPRTVENHLTAIFAKLGANNRADAVTAAEALGIISQSE
jgi:DNA-binding CsgD family transcriptional regulator